jgi:hypothetical protein
MRALKKIKPDAYILAVLTDDERFEAAVAVARQAFQGTRLKKKDIEMAITAQRRSRIKKSK